MAHILVVDDDTEVRKSLNRCFSRCGHMVTGVPELAQAVTKINQENIDLIILDLVLQGERGSDLLKNVRDAKSDLPIVIYSGMITKEEECAIREAGANEVLLKGGSFIELRNSVENILKARHRLFQEPARERTLLIVDDEAEIRSALRRFFRKKNYKILEASNGEEALELAKTNKINCALLDVQMPGMSGLEVLPKLRETDPGIGVVMVSGAKEEHLVKTAVQNGACGYITKPFDFVYLELIVAAKLMIAGTD